MSKKTANRFLAVLLSVILAFGSFVPAYATDFGEMADPVETMDEETGLPVQDGSQGLVTESYICGEDGTLLRVDPSSGVNAVEENSGDSGTDNEAVPPVSEGEPVSSVSGDSTPSENSTPSANTLDSYRSVAGVQTKPYLLKGTDFSNALFGMVKGQKWFAGKGAASSDKNILKVDKKGFVTAKNAGEAEVSAEGKTYKIKVVTPTLSGKKITLAVGEHAKVSLDGVSGFTTSWITDNANVAQVYDGTIYATGRGKTKINAFVGGKAFVITVKVNDKASSTYLMNTPLKKAMKIAVPKAAKVGWTPSANSVSLNSVSGYGSGTTQNNVTVLKGKATSNGTGLCNVKGDEGHALRVYGNDPVLNTTTGLAAAGKTNVYTIKMKPGEKFLLDFPYSHELPRWKSSKPSVASVNEFGLVYADAAGTTKLTTKAAGKKVSVNVTVGDESTVIPGKNIITKQLVDDINGYKTVIVIYNEATGEYETKEILIDPSKSESGDDPDNPANLYNVDFDSNGGTNVASQKVAEGGKVVRPADPTRTSFIFDGWLKDGFLYSFNDSVTADTTLVADWYNENDESTRKSFVILDANGGTFSDGEEFLVKKLPKGSNLNIASISPVWDGYSFIGWFYHDGTPARNSDTVNGDVTVYAHWRNNLTGEIIDSVKTLVLFDDAHGGVIIKRVNNNRTVDAPTVSWEGHRFDFWLYRDGSAYMPDDIFTEPTVLTAKWTVTGGNDDGTYNIVYNLAGGKNDPANPYVYSKEDEFVIKNPTKEGSRFTGWLMFINGIRQGDGTDTAVKIFKGTEGNIILVANWSSGKYTLSFNSTGGNTIATKGLEFGQEFGILPSPQRLGYNFGGWFYSPEEGAREAKETDLMPATNLTLYAAWTENEFMSYSITYNLNDEGGKSRATHRRPKMDYTKNSDGFWLVNPEREGYEFLGWTGTDLGQEPVEDVYVPRGSSGNRIYNAHWSDYVNPVFTITYDLSDEDSEIKAEHVNYKTDYTKNSDSFTLVNPTRWGYIFTGWVGTGINAADGPQTTVKVPRGSTGNRSYKATWIADPNGPGLYVDHPYSTLTLNLGEMDGAIIDSVTYSLSEATTGSGTLRDGESLRMLTGTNVMLFAPTNGDNAFYNDFWNSEETDPSSGEGRIFVFEITQDTVVTLECEKNMQYFTYDIDYDLAGGWFNKSVPKSSYTIKTPDFVIGEPTKTGYTFLGWTGTGLDPVEMPKTFTVSQGSTGNRTYAANWSGANTYDLRFNPNGGTCAMQKKSVEYGQTFGALPVPIYEHYDFQGWYTAATGGDKVTATTIMETEGATVYAHWTPVDYTLTFNANGGSVSPTSKVVTYGQAYGSLPTPDRNYCEFVGWYTAAAGGDPVTSASIMAGNTTIYAHWLGQEVTVTFDANGGSVGTTSKVVNYAAAYGDLPTPVYQHYDFLGWYTAASGGTKITSTSQVGQVIGHTLFAHWTGTTYKITYNANGGTGSVPEQSYSYGDALTINGPVGSEINMFKDGYVFDGWNTDPDGNGTDYTSGQKLSVTRTSFTLYAQWKTPTASFGLIGVGSASSYITKARIYDTYGYYREYTSFSSIPIYPGGDIVLFSNSTERVWRPCMYVCGTTYMRAAITGDSYSFTVPENAAGRGCVRVQATAGSGFGADDLQLTPYASNNDDYWSAQYSTGEEMWHRYVATEEFPYPSNGTGSDYMCYPWLCPFIPIKWNSNSSLYFNTKSYDKYGYCHTGDILYPGGKFVMISKDYVTAQGPVQWYCFAYGLFNSDAIHFTVPSSANAIAPWHVNRSDFSSYFRYDFYYTGVSWAAPPALTIEAGE